MFKISHHFNHFKRRRCDWFQYISVHISSWNELGLRSFQKERTANLAVCACWDASWEIWKKHILDLKNCDFDFEFLYFQLRLSSKVFAFRFLGADLTSPAMCTRTYSTHLTILRKLEIPGYCARPHCPTFQYVLFLTSCLFWELAFK